VSGSGQKDRSAEKRAASWESKARRDLLRFKIFGMLLAIALLAFDLAPGAYLLTAFVAIAILQGIQDELHNIWIQNNDRKGDRR
jgi:hypothetical protein